MKNSWLIAADEAVVVSSNRIVIGEFPVREVDAVLPELVEKGQREGLTDFDGLLGEG